MSLEIRLTSQRAKTLLSWYNLRRGSLHEAIRGTTRKKQNREDCPDSPVPAGNFEAPSSFYMPAAGK